MVLSKLRTTKAQIRLRQCAGWSAPVLFATPEDRFSRIEAQIISFTELLMQISKLLLPQTGMSPKFDAALHCNILHGPEGQSVASQIADPGVAKLKLTFKKKSFRNKHSDLD